MKFLTSIPPDLKNSLASNPYKKQYDSGVLVLEQDKIVENFIKKYNINTICYTKETTWKIKNKKLSSTPDLLLVSIDDKIELALLVKLIIQFYSRTSKYLYIAINKYKIYTDIEQSIIGLDFDHNIIVYLEKKLNDYYKLLEYHYDKDDDGTKGNYIHPSTQLFLCKI